jgi:hypothetical protein
VSVTPRGSVTPTPQLSLRRGARLLLASIIALSAVAAYPLVAGASDPCSITTPCSKTVSTNNGAMTNPVAGVITASGLAANSTYSVADALQPLPNNGSNANRFYRGTYTLTWNSCSSGTAVGSTFNVGPNLASTSFPAGIPPMTAGALASITTDAAGSFSCGYSLSFTVTPVSGPVVSVRNDIFMMSGATPAAHFASPSVGAPPLTPPPGIPEAPLMVLLPLSALLIFGLTLVREFRKQATAAVR